MKNEKNSYLLNQKEKKLICPVKKINGHNDNINSLISPVKKLDKFNSIEKTNNVLKDQSQSLVPKITSNNLNDDIYNPSFLNNIQVIENDDESQKLEKEFDLQKKMYFLSNIDKIIEDIINCKTNIIPNKHRYIGDYLFSKITLWKKNDLIFVNCGTGSGKSSFIKMLVENKQLQFNILILTNRVANRKQIENELDYLFTYYPKHIVISSYQSIGLNDFITSKKLDQFDFIFCDESHFFLSDVEFNQMANSSFSKIMHTKNATKIFLSATNEEITKIAIKSYAYNNYIYDITTLLDNVWIYTLSYNRSNVHKIIKFTKFDEIIDRINLSNEKWLIFVKSKADGNKYLELLKNSTNKKITFLNRDNITINDNDACKTLNDLIIFQKFEDDVLLSTSIIDNGVNIIDKELTNIVCFDYDYIELIQEIGRKRCIDDTDRFDLYLYNDKLNKLVGIKNSKKNLLSSFKQTKKDLNSRRTINPIILDGDNRSKTYIKALYINQYNNEFSFNYLGYYNLKREIKMLDELTLNDKNTFDIKKKWIEDNLQHKAEECNNDIDRYIQMIDKYLNIEISNKDVDAKLFLSQNFMEYIFKDKHDRPSRPFGLNKLIARFKEYAIPIKIEKGKKTFKLVYTKK